VRRGLARAAENSGLGARLQQVGGVLLDAAHNPDGAVTLAGALRAAGAADLVVVFGVMKDKDHRGMLEALAPHAACFVAVEAKIDRSLPAGALLRSMRTEGLPAVRGGGVAQGLLRARAMASGRGILVTGSHFVAGEALAALRRRKA
jgi:dihydrofolate synthase/folylpolyglutamate synthase